MDDQPKKRRRGLKLAIGTFLFVALLLIVGPLLAAPLVRNRVVSGVEESLNVRASLERLSFDAGGGLALAGLALDDLQGRPLARLGNVEAEVAVLRALTGTYSAELEVREFELHLRKEADGRWNFENLKKETGDESPGEASGSDADESLPGLKLRARFENGRVVVHGAEGASELRDIQITADLPSLEERGQFSVSATVFGPDGAAGTLSATADITLAENGRLDPLAMQGDLALLITDVLLPALEPALGLMTEIDSLAGEARGEASFRLSPGLLLDGTLDFNLSELAVATPRTKDDPVRISSIRLTGSSNLEGRQELDLAVDDFLSVDYAGTSSAKDGSVDGKLTLDGDVQGLAEVGRAWLPWKEGSKFAGTLEGRVDLASPSDLNRVNVASGLELRDFTAHDASGKVLDVGELANLVMNMDANLDLDTGSIEVPRFALDAGPVQASGSGRLASSESTSGTDAAFTLDADLTRLRESLAAFVEDEALAMGGSLHATGRALGEPERIAVSVDVEARGVSFSGIGVECEPLALTATIETPEAGEPHVTGKLAGGRFSVELEIPKDAEGSETREAAFEPSQKPLPTDKIALSAGGLTVPFELSPAGETMSVSLDARIASFACSVTPAGGRAGSTLEEPNVQIELGARLAGDAGTTLERLAFESSFLSGQASGTVHTDPDGKTRFEGLVGNFQYVPDRLGLLVEPWLPGRLSGAEPETLQFHLDGEAAELDLFTLLSASKGDATLGLGLFETTGLATQGEMTFTVENGRAKCTGGLEANEGSLTIEGELGLEHTEGATPSRLTVTMESVQANAELSPLLGLVHPAFAGLESLQEGGLGGLLSCTLDVMYDGPLDKEKLSAGWDALPKTPISGSGRLELGNASISGSALVGELLTSLGVDTTKQLSLDPIEFKIQNGRVHYDKPWTWTLSDAKTTFTGSVGLDKSLQLMWNVPVTQALVDKHDFLSLLAGQTLNIPISGSVTQPKLEWRSVLNGLAKTAVQDQLTEGVGELLGGGGDAEALLKEANGLWNGGKKKEAAAIYAKIRKEHKTTTTYLLNRSRIKDRAKYKGD